MLEGLAVMTGFQEGIRGRVIAATPHILIFEGSGRGMRDAPALLERVRDVPGVRSVAPFVMQQALFTVSGGGATGGLVRGVDIASESVRKDLTRQIKMGSLEPLGRSGGEPAIILGGGLGRTLGVIPGEIVTVI